MGGPLRKVRYKRKARDSKSSKKKRAARFPILVRAPKVPPRLNRKDGLPFPTTCQQEQQQQQPQKKVTKKGRFIVEEEEGSVKTAPSQRGTEIEQMCEKMVLLSRAQEETIRSLREENESLRRKV